MSFREDCLDHLTYRDHLIIMDYLHTTLEACGAKRSWVISCTRWSRLAWPLTWISIGIIYSLRTIYLPSLKLLEQIVLELSVARDYGVPTYWPTDMCKAMCPPSSKGGITSVILNWHICLILYCYSIVVKQLWRIHELAYLKGHF